MIVMWMMRRCGLRLPVTCVCADAECGEPTKRALRLSRCRLAGETVRAVFGVHKTYKP